MDILVTVVNQKLRIATNLQNLVSGSHDFIRFIFDLSSDWDDMTTFAQFQQSGIAYNRSLDENNAVYFPQEIRAGTCKMTLYGSGNGKTGTTNNVTLYVDENTFVYDAIPGDGVPEALSDRLSQIEDSIRNVSTAISGKYTLPAGGIPYNDLSSAVQQMISNNGGSGSAEPIIVQGDTSTTYGFATQAALTSFRNDYPNAFKQGDYVWVKDGDYASHTYTLYVVNQNKQLSDVFKIGDTLVVTVSSDAYGQLSVNKTIAQINTELNNGKNIALRTEYGVVLNPTYYAANSIFFTTVADFDGEFYARTYSITGNGLSVSTKSLSEGTGFKVVKVAGNDDTGYQVDSEHSDITSPTQINAILHNDRSEDVRMEIGGWTLPCVSAALDNAQFSGLVYGVDSGILAFAYLDFDGSVTLTKIRTEDLALKSDIISGGGSGSGSDVTEATVAAWGFIKNLQSKGYGYATNEQTAVTTARTASLSGFVLTTGGNVVVKFTNSVPANATLNVNSTGAKNIRYRGANITSGIINGGDLVSFRYDGTYYVIESIDKSQYLVPSTGIPLSDLSSSVQASLEKADGAVQNNFGSANNGKPIVVNSAGNAVVGSWPLSDGSGGTVTWQDILPNGGIPGTDLSTDVQNAIITNKYLIAFNSPNGTTGTLADVSSIDDLYNIWYGNKYYVALSYSEFGSYEFPLVFIDSAKEHAVFAGAFRDTSTGVIKIASFYASESNNTVTAIKTVTTPGSESGGSGTDESFSSEAKLQLITILRAVDAWKVTTAPSMVDNLEAALFPSSADGDVSISAVFSQSDNIIYDNDDLDVLRQYLTVTATSSGGSATTVTGYTLSGTLSVGISTITVTYSGATTTFSVTVTQNDVRFCEWISTEDNTNWIQTDVVPNNSFGFKYRWTPLFASYGTVGCRQDSGNTRCGIYIEGGKIYAYWGTSNNTQVSWTSGMTFEMSLNYKNNRKALIDGSDTSAILGTLSGITTRTFDLLGRNNADGHAGTAQKFYGAEFTSGSDVTHIFVPAYKTSTGDIGVYDRLNHTFLGNSGTGTFTKGADV